MSGETIKYVFINILILSVLLCVFTSRGNASSGRTIIIRNNTGATIQIILNGVMRTEKLIAPHSQQSFFNYLIRGRNVLQIHALCVQGRPGIVKTLWVSGRETSRQELILSPHIFGRSAMADMPRCQELADVREDMRRRKITIQSATYGFNCNGLMIRGNRCTITKGNSTGHIRSQCNGKEWCSYTIDWQQIGDPCVGCRKEYKVIWKCGSIRKEKVVCIGGQQCEASGHKVILSCP